MRMKITLLFGLMSLGCAMSTQTLAANLINDGTFLQPIGSPWISWTGVSVTTASAAGYSLPGNYAILPSNGVVGSSGTTDLFQVITIPTSGLYTETFYAANFSDHVAYLDVGAWGATPTNEVAVVTLAPESGFQKYSYTVNMIAGSGAEPWFGNSYDQVFWAQGTVNPAGTNLGVADVSLTLATSAVPEPSTWAMMILGFAGIGFMAYRRRSSAVLAA